MPKFLGTITAPALASAPSVGVAGALYYNTTDGSLYKSNGSAWSAVGGSSGGGATVSDTPPSSPTAGQLWYESDTGITYVYYDSQWIEVGGSGTSGFVVSDTAPSSPVVGMGWYKSDTGQTFIYYSSAWVELAGGPAGPIGQSTLPWTKTGTLTTITGALDFPMPFDGTILGVSARAGTGPTGADLIFDVNKNGTTIFTTQANRPKIVAGSLSTASEVTNMDVTSFVAGDYISIDIDQVGSTIAGADVTVVIRYRDAYGAVQYQPGMVLITSQSFSAASAVNINNCFTSTYENYRVVVKSQGTVAGTAYLHWRARLSGTDNSSANYDYAGTVESIAAGPTKDYSGGATQGVIGNVGNISGMATFDVIAPAITDYTSTLSLMHAHGNTPAMYAGIYTTRMTVTTAYDGITLYPASGTFSGTVRVYGYRN